MSDYDLPPAQRLQQTEAALNQLKSRRYEKILNIVLSDSEDAEKALERQKAELESKIDRLAEVKAELEAEVESESESTETTQDTDT